MSINIINHDISFTQERREEGRCLSEVDVHYVYTGLKKVTIS